MTAKGPTLEEEIARVLNCASAENASNTPDFILARFLRDCLVAWNVATLEREGWYGRGPNSLAREQEQSQSDAEPSEVAGPLGQTMVRHHAPERAKDAALASSASDPSPAQAGVETEWMLDRLCEGDPAYLVQVPRAVIRQLRDAQISNDRYAVNAQYDAERIAALEQELARYNVPQIGDYDR